MLCTVRVEQQPILSELEYAAHEHVDYVLTLLDKLPNVLECEDAHTDARLTAHRITCIEIVHINKPPLFGMGRSQRPDRGFNSRPEIQVQDVCNGVQ